MSTEIEFKYLISDENVVEKINNLLADLPVSVNFSSKQLTNYYFDTPKLDLRSCDIGLRIRGDGDCLEQTIKTSGRIVGGLHQRPEYNVVVDKNFPDLTLFPASIWPENSVINEWQERLVKLFSTDFSRCQWLVTLANQTQIELVFDQGEICVQERKEGIFELELELVNGHLDDLYSFAALLVEQVNVRPGILSKAARGYSLWREQVHSVELSPLPLVPLNNTSSLPQAFTKGIEFSLQQLQQLVDAYVREPSLVYLDKISEVLALLRHGFWLFDRHLSPEAITVRDELSYFVKLLVWVDNASFLQQLTVATVKK